MAKFVFVRSKKMFSTNSHMLFPFPVYISKKLKSFFNRRVNALGVCVCLLRLLVLVCLFGVCVVGQKKVRCKFVVVVRWWLGGGRKEGRRTINFLKCGEFQYGKFYKAW